MGLYEEHGIRINREPFGPLTGTLIPPFMSHAVLIIEGLLALEQGVKSITVGYGTRSAASPRTSRRLNLFANSPTNTLAITDSTIMS